MEKGGQDGRKKRDEGKTKREGKRSFRRRRRDKSPLMEAAVSDRCRREERAQSCGLPTMKSRHGSSDTKESADDLSNRICR